MQKVKMSFLNASGILSRSEMKVIMAGSGDATKCGTCDYGNSTCTKDTSLPGGGICTCPTSSGGANTQCT